MIERSEISELTGVDLYPSVCLSKSYIFWINEFMPSELIKDQYDLSFKKTFLSKTETFFRNSISVRIKNYIRYIQIKTDSSKNNEYERASSHIVLVNGAHNIVNR